MRVSVIRKDIKFTPDSKRVVARYFMNGEERTKQMVARIMMLNEKQVLETLEQTLREFARRHRNISAIFFRHCEKIKPIIEAMQIDYEAMTLDRKMLIGSYCTMEYAIESAAIFNPSIIEDFDQSGLEAGEKRVIISFRATGEGHISSIVFRRGILDKDNNLQVMKIGHNIDKAEIEHKTLFNKERFLLKLSEMHTQDRYIAQIMQDLPNEFEFAVLKSMVNTALSDPSIRQERRTALEEILWLADSFYDLQFKHDSDLTERVIFPISESESRGIEDARFVRFEDDDGSSRVMATYTAYNGHAILPKLISTEDFYTFRVMPLHGAGAQNKNLALFPRKIKGKLIMFHRIRPEIQIVVQIDSLDELTKEFWQEYFVRFDDFVVLSPKYEHEKSYIGGGCPPIETEFGWLIIYHGVHDSTKGYVYSACAALLDLENPQIEIARLPYALFHPEEIWELKGEVNNVCFPSGTAIFDDTLYIYYGAADERVACASTSLSELLQELMLNKQIK